MPEICPKCGTANKVGRSTCTACGAELELALFAEMFGPPRKLKARYVVQRLAKRGTTVSLYHALDTHNDNRPCLIHQVALTSLSFDSQEVVEHRFIQEAARWQACQHPNLLPILDADVQNHRLYLVTGAIRGISLRSIANDRSYAIPEKTLLYWAGQLCDVLDYLHSQDPPFVLGCMSPSAIHVDETGQAQVTEVGLTRYKQSGLLGPAKGVRGYAAPEQKRGQVTPLSDLYTVGIILYQLATRCDPRERPLPSLEKYARGFSDQVLDAVSRAYRRDPEKRYTSASEMRQRLLGTVTETVVQLPPFTLTTDCVASTVPALIQMCTTNWEEGLLALTTGRIADWLNDAVDALRADDRSEDAAQVAEWARKTALAQEQIQQDASGQGLTASAREIAHNATYASWLRDMGAMGVQPSLQVQPARFDFGVVGAKVKAKSAIHIHNRGQGYLSGRIESLVPWLVIPDAAFGCRAGQEAVVRVEALGRRLPTGDSASRQAIRISSNGGDAWIEATASSSPPVLSVEKQVLSFGSITRGASRVEHLAVINAGGGRLNGLVVSRAPWLRVRHPSFSCPAGASAQIAVELLSQELPKGAVRIRRALAIDSDSGQAEIDVTWKWARATLELDTTGLDLGSVEHGARVESAITLSNTGNADLIGESSSAVGWLSVEPAQFTCAPGSVQKLSIVCDTSMLPGGSTVEAEAITIRANAGTQTISASVEVLAPRLVISNTVIDLGTVQDGERVEETIMVGNQGSLPWEGHAYTDVPWLSIEPDEIRCQPGHFIPVTLLLHTESLESGGTHTADRAIRIRGLGQERTLSVRVHLLRPQLAIERHSIDLGLIGRTDIAEVPLEIANDGTGQLEWEIAVQGTWLEIIPMSGICGPGETKTVQVRAYALAVDGDSGQAWLTVRSNGGRADLPASVSLSSPLLAVEPLILELHSENYALPAQSIRISNRGVGELSGTAVSQVPWLQCSPESFTCPTGVSTQIDIQPQLDGLREGTYDALTAIRVDSNGGTETIEARLTLALTPKLHVSARELRPGDSGRATFQLGNRGYGTLHVQVIPHEDWIAVNRTAWTIKAGKDVRLQVVLNNAPPGVEGTIEIRTSEETVFLSVLEPSDTQKVTQ